MAGGSKLKDIKETASDAVEIMRELGTPGVQETFDKIKEVAVIAKEIMEMLKTPEWVQNLENIRVITQNMNDASTRMDNTIKEIKDTGIIDDAKKLISTARNKMDAFGEAPGGVNSQDLRETATAFKEMLQSIRSLVDELKITVTESKKYGTVRDVQETMREIAGTYRTVKRDVTTDDFSSVIEEKVEHKAE